MQDARLDAGAELPIVQQPDRLEHHGRIGLAFAEDNR